MGLDDILKGWAVAKQGIQEFATARAINDAQGQIEQMKGMEMNEMKRRAALGQIGNSLALELGKLGAPVSQIQSAVGAIKPEAIRTSQDAYTQGLTDYAKELQSFEQTPNIENREDNQRFQSGMQDKKFNQALMLESIKNKGGANAKLSKAEIEFETNAEVAIDEAKKLKKTVMKVGNYESDSSFSIFSDPKASADLSNAAYKLAIAYAKIVDPESVAREGEVEAAKKYAIPMGATTDNKTTLRAIDNYIKEINQRQKIRNRLKLQGITQSSDDATAESSDDINSLIDWE
jgi:hypothetical protein